MVGDTTWDCEAAERAGVPTIALLSGGFGKDELKSGRLLPRRDAALAQAYELIRGPDLGPGTWDLLLRGLFACQVGHVQAV